MRFYLMLFFLVILIAVAFVFGTQNNQIISLNYFIARVELSVAQAVSLFTLIGIFIGVFITISWRVKRAMIKRKKTKVKNKVQQTVTPPTTHLTNHKVSS
jgi:lipopolysaccharide assembly protein A